MEISGEPESSAPPIRISLKGHPMMGLWNYRTEAPMPCPHCAAGPSRAAAPLLYEVWCRMRKLSVNKRLVERGGRGNGYSTWHARPIGCRANGQTGYRVHWPDRSVS